MSMLDLMTIAPELVLIVTAALVVILDDFNVDERIQVWVSSIGAVASALFIVVFAGSLGSAFGGVLLNDPFAVFFKLLLAGSLLIVVAASLNYLPHVAGHKGEYFAMLMLATAGMMFLVSSTDFITMFVALETTAIGLYILAGIARDAKSSEAGLKYLLLGAISTAVMLYGIALVYALTGTTSFAGIASGLATMPEANRAALMLAITLIAAGFGFKMAAVPFQMWVPDVYEGAPTPVTMFLSVSSKAAGFAITLRVFQTAFGLPEIAAEWSVLFAWLAAASMTVGNVVALPQTNIKRMMGYSSIAQAGYIMVGLAVVQSSGPAGVLFFLAAYAITNLAAFFAIAMISERLGSDQIPDYAGLFRRAPALALALGVCMLSLTGIPPTAGFWAKVAIFGAAIEHGYVWLALVGVINSVISAYYYLGVVRAMFMMSPVNEEPLRASPALGALLAAAAVLVLAVGILPTPFIELATAAAAALVP